MAAKITFVDPLIRVRNVRRAASWYRRMLGLKVEMAMPNRSKPVFVRMTAGDPNGVAIMISDGSDPTTGRKAPKSVAGAIGARKAQRVVSFYYRVDRGINALFESVRRKRATIVSPPQTMPYGMREFTLRDPDGYEVQVGQEIAPARPRRRPAKRRAGTRPRRPRR